MQKEESAQVLRGYRAGDVGEEEKKLKAMRDEDRKKSGADGEAVGE